MSGTEYRIFFLDEEAHIQARQEFRAADDADAVLMAAVLAEACSDTCVGYELWDHARLIHAHAASARGGARRCPALDEIAIEMQQSILELEDTFQRSHWHVARSRKLIDSIEDLRDRLKLSAESSSVCAPKRISNTT